MLELNKIYCESNLDTMARMPDGFVDLTVTSPPYDNLRSYKNGVGLQWNFRLFTKIAKELYRVTKEGGIVVWVVSDKTVKKSETGTSFKQALYFLHSCKFLLYDTMIYRTHKAPLNDARYQQCFEYMFILSNGSPKSVNLILEDCKKFGSKTTRYTGHREVTGEFKDRSGSIVTKKQKPMENIWEIYSGYGVDDPESFSHPARFPEELAKRHILSWSNPGDIVYDPFMGSGTTAKMALLNGRQYIGSEISEEYCQIAEQRVAKALASMQSGDVS